MMARGSVHVTYESVDPTRIPDSLTEGVALLMLLAANGELEQVGERLLIRREGGYCGLDVWLVLFVFFTFGATRGLKAFWEKVLRPHVLQVAAVAGRRGLPSPASVSRALSAVEWDLLREVSGWLLVGVSQIDAVLRHPVVRTRDAVGQDWHLFDLDPTVTTLRQRALPEDDELPEPRRRAEHTGAPGYSGRKRGELVFRRTTVQHLGSSAWIHAHLSAGNGEGVADLERGLDSVVQTCERLEHPLDRALVRMDGEYGNVPYFTACRARGLPFITRLNRPKLFEDREVLARLRSAKWYAVPDSKSGPRRCATDLGALSVPPGERTRRPDGGSYEPVEVRVVASIFPKTGKAKRGRILDGYQVELFAVDVTADAWPAPEAVASYFGRNAQENRFAQEDRELGLDRIISYELPGQELATLVGLSVWNLRVANGFLDDRPPVERPDQPLRCSPVDDCIPAGWPRDPVVNAGLGELDWSKLLENRSGWRMDSATGELLCGEQRPLTLTTVRAAEHAEGRTGVIFRRPSGGCQHCSSRPGCLQSVRADAVKHAEFAVPSCLATRLRERLAHVRALRDVPATIEAIEAPPGSHAVETPLFLPAMARQVFAARFTQATLNVEVGLPDAKPPRPRLVAVDAADRQRRRKTWTQNLERYALPAQARVDVVVAGSDTLRQMLGERRRSTARVRSAG